jgi:NAD(P)-dependent dehydrogenase (short-subunit alcohol dehydrogenase family)
MPTVFVTGANRGIGFEFVRQYAADGWTVHAGVRNPAASAPLRALGADRVSIHALDVDDRDQIKALAAALDGAPIDLLINNAGIWVGDDEKYGRFSDDQWMAQFSTHVFGAMAMCEALVDNVAASDLKLMANISSGNGSLGWAMGIGDYPYNTTKAALNMVGRGLAVRLKDRGITVVSLTPGNVATDMSGPNADLTPEESISGMRRVIAGLDQSQSGGFMRYNGDIAPW